MMSVVFYGIFSKFASLWFGLVNASLVALDGLFVFASPGDKSVFFAYSHSICNDKGYSGHWIDYDFNIWPIKTMIISPGHTKFA